jgi:hypothetical protein
MIDPTDLTEALNASIAALPPTQAAGEVDAYLEVLPDVKAMLAASAAGEPHIVEARAKLLWQFITGRARALAKGHPALTERVESVLADLSA